MLFTELPLFGGGLYHRLDYIFCFPTDKELMRIKRRFGDFTATGAGIGTAFGPIGTAVGAGVGLVVDIICEIFCGKYM